MQTRSGVVTQSLPTVSEQIQVESVEISTVRLQLIEPFETSFGRIDSRLVVVVSIAAGGLSGWGR